MIHYPQDSTAKCVIRFEVIFYFLAIGYLRNVATLLFWPNSIVLSVTGLTRVYCNYIQWRTHYIFHLIFGTMHMILTLQSAKFDSAGLRNHRITTIFCR